MSDCKIAYSAHIPDNFHETTLLFALKFSKTWPLTANFSFRPVKSDRLLASEG